MVRECGLANRGATFEATVRQACDAYARAGRGRVVKIEVGVRQVARADTRTGKFDAVRMRSYVDFIGNVDGVPVAFDCKETREARFQRSKMREHQRTFLSDFGMPAKAFAGVMIRFARTDAVWLVEWSWLRPWMLAYPSVGENDLAGIVGAERVRVGVGVAYDFAKAMHAIREKARRT